MNMNVHQIRDLALAAQCCLTVLFWFAIGIYIGANHPSKVAAAFFTILAYLVIAFPVYLVLDYRLGLVARRQTDEADTESSD